MLKARKVKRRLEARQKDFDVNIVGANVVKGPHGNYHRPGSLKR